MLLLKWEGLRLLVGFQTSKKEYVYYSGGQKKIIDV